MKVYGKFKVNLYSGKAKNLKKIVESIQEKGNFAKLTEDKFKKKFREMFKSSIIGQRRVLT